MYYFDLFASLDYVRERMGEKVKACVFLFGSCYGLDMVCDHKNSRWGLIPNVAVLGGEAFRRWLGHALNTHEWTDAVLQELSVSQG